LTPGLNIWASSWLGPDRRVVAVVSQGDPGKAWYTAHLAVIGLTDGTASPAQHVFDGLEDPGNRLPSAREGRSSAVAPPRCCVDLRKAPIVVPEERLGQDRRMGSAGDHQHPGLGGPVMAPTPGTSGTARSAAYVDSAYWRGRLAELIDRHHVPGAALGILYAGGVVDVAAGVLSRSTLVEATSDSLFQIGSITKVWTATLVMQLIDEGSVALDTPVAEVLPDFAVADASVTRQVTVRHLLTHTSGIDGDVLIDTGRGDDSVERYVASMRDVPQIHPLGATFSYCNSGYAVAGRIVEVLTGTSWDTALRERIIDPLGQTATVTLPEDAILHRAAVGHLGEARTDQTPTTVWMLPRGRGPAGRISARAHDVLAFVRMHLAGGATPAGTRVLSSGSARAMTERQVDFPDPSATSDSWGLGWVRFDWGGHRLIGHDGGTIGQRAYLRILPDREFAVVLLSNGGDTAGLYREVFSETFGELVGVAMPAALIPPAEPVTVDLDPYEGRYCRGSLVTDIVQRDGALELTSTSTGLITRLFPGPPSNRQTLVPLGDGRFAAGAEGASSWDSVYFYTLPDGTRYFHQGSRANPRTTTTPPTKPPRSRSG
jgi:CubicO group peptidase (beta-lactamase class C family)